MTETLPQAFAAAVDRYGDRTALIEGDGTKVSFSALKYRADGLAAAWAAKGIGKGDRILIAMPICADLYAALAALWSLGAVAVLPEPAMGLNGVRNAVENGQVKGLCASGAYRLLRFVLPALWGKPLLHPGQASKSAAPISDTQPNDLALISFTSGTTGAPKAIPRSHAFLMAQARAVSPLLKSDIDEIDLVAFPVFVLINLAEGRSSVLPNWKMRHLDRLTSAQLTDWIAKQSVTRLLLPPALCETLADGTIPANINTIFTGGGPVFPDLIARLKAGKNDLRIVSVYGSTEAEPIAEHDTAHTTTDDLTAMKTGKGLLAGFPVPDINLRITDGEIVVSGQHVNQGYLDPARDAENKRREGDTIWHRTGDAGYLDDQGRLWLLGRWGNVVPTANRPLYPFAVETAARLWAGVQRAALMHTDQGPILVIEGDAAHRADWTKNARIFGIDDVRPISKMPMDRRHYSKIDMATLKKRLPGRQTNG